jgi:hypothetical protein
MESTNNGGGMRRMGRLTGDKTGKDFQAEFKVSKNPRDPTRRGIQHHFSL